MVTQSFVVDVARAVAGAGSVTQRLERLHAAPLAAFVDEAHRRGVIITHLQAQHGRDGLIASLEVERSLTADEAQQLSLF